MPLIDNLDFLNLNSLRSFPIRETTTRISVDGSFTIPDDLMVDLVISATSDVTKKFYVSKIQNYQQIITIEISDHNNLVLGLFTVTASDHVQNKEYTMAPNTNNYFGATGKLTVGVLTTLNISPVGAYTFSLSTAEIEPRCIIPSISAINRFIFIDEKGNNQSITGDVKILARNNLRFRKDGATNTIVIDAGDGLGLNKDCDNASPCIKTIRNVPPDEHGNFTLIGSDCAQFSEMASPPGLLLSETCCKPCMGCDEIGQLTETAMQLEADIIKLRDYITQTNNQFLQFTTLTNHQCEC
jgi:hypothetical protein